MEPHPEHQQDHAEFGELGRDLAVGDIPRSKGPDQDAGEQVARDRRDLQPVRQSPHGEGRHKAGDDRGDERRMVEHGVTVGRTNPAFNARKDEKGRGDGGETSGQRHGREHESKSRKEHHLPLPGSGGLKGQGRNGRVRPWRGPVQLPTHEACPIRILGLRCIL